VQDLAHPILEFQSLTKVMLRKWREVRVDIDKPDHKRALRSISAASYVDSDSSSSRTGSMGSKRIKDPERWRRVGFDSEMPGREFEDTGFLGMMDLTDYVVGNEDQFRKLVLEQSNKPPELRCAIAKASLAMTLVLYEHFEIDKGDNDDTQKYAILESRANFDKAFKPLLLHWSRLHTAGLNAFLRLWKATGAEAKDFERMADLVRILIEQVVGQASRTKDIGEAEDELADFDYHRLRELQMERLGVTYEEAWGHQLRYESPNPTLSSLLRILTSIQDKSETNSTMKLSLLSKSSASVASSPALGSRTRPATAPNPDRSRGKPSTALPHQIGVSSSSHITGVICTTLTSTPRRNPNPH